MSPFAGLWLAIDVAALVLAVAALTRGDRRAPADLRPLLAA
jgi:hypothetical protein